jgi:Gram-negative bacterial TonB protein C-terminal
MELPLPSQMKSIARLLVCYLLLTTLRKDALAENLPQFRPALLGHHKQSLINTIDTQMLVKRGQGDGFVMFGCTVSQDGSGYWSRTYRCSPNTELLQKEVLGRIDRAMFEPAVYKGSHVGVYLMGSVVFAVRDGKPHLRIFLHQEEDDLKKGNDFIAPQFAFAPGNTKFKGIYYPPQAPGGSGVASVKLKVNEMGQVQAASVTYEHPPGMGFGAQTVDAIRDAAFIPGFRNGKPVACQFNWTIIFTGSGRQMKTG